MHTLLAFSSLALIVLGAYLLLGVLGRVAGWSPRRDLQFLVLAAPFVSVGLGIAALHHFSGQTCYLDAPGWDVVLGAVLPLSMVVVAGGGLSFGLIRLVLLQRVLAKRAVPASEALRARVARLAEQVGIPAPPVRVCPTERPLAVTYGLRRPTLLLSTWILTRLDTRELDAVVAHELGHIARRDYLVVWVATVLRDAFFYLPTSWAAYRRLQHEKELACDDVAVGTTNRPLALASALAKVWQQAVGGPSYGVAQQLVNAGGPIELRIERLLTRSDPTTRTHSRRLILGFNGLALLGLLALEAANVALLSTAMGCGPSWLLQRLP